MLDDDFSTLTIITLASWDWFRKWDSRPVKKRGDDYDAIKKSIGDDMIEQVDRTRQNYTIYVFKDVGLFGILRT